MEVSYLREFDGKIEWESIFSRKDGNRLLYSSSYGFFILCDDLELRLMKFEDIEKNYYNDRRDMDESYISMTKHASNPILSSSISADGKLVALVFDDKISIFNFTAITGSDETLLDGKECFSILKTRSDKKLPLLAWTQVDGLSFFGVGIDETLNIIDLNLGTSSSIVVPGLSGFDFSQSGEEIVAIGTDFFYFFATKTCAQIEKMKFPYEEASGKFTFAKFRNDS